ncbi:MAG: tail fiber domain-containing protein [Ruminococcaceae bacterium]|nr:tail fiber domain-containing protein [Oscillospiraceae bacterium]
MPFLDKTGFTFFWENLPEKFAASLSVTNSTLTLKSGSGATMSTSTVNNVANAYACSGTAAKATTAVTCTGNSATATKAQSSGFALGAGGASFYSSKAGELYLAASTETAYRAFLGVSSGVWTFMPGGNATLQLGTANNRWGQIYSAQSQISTSDRNDKTDIAPADSGKMLQLLMLLMPKSFKFRDGTSGRTHYGFIAQDVEQALADCGMSDMDFAAFTKSPKYETIQVFTEEYLDEETFEIVPASMCDESILVPNEYIYGLRYEEFIAPLLSVVQSQQKTIETQQTEINTLRADLNTVLTRLDALEKKKEV